MSNDEAINDVCEKVRKLRADLELEKTKVWCLSGLLGLCIVGLIVLAIVR